MTRDGPRDHEMKSLRTSLRVLTEFMGNQPDFGVGELAERCRLPKSQVSKILRAFGDFGLLAQEPTTRRYSVGLRAFALGARFVNYDRLSKEALPIMRDLVERCGHSARLSVMDGDDVLYLLSIEGPHFVDTGWRAGTWLPLHSTTAGRVFLAYLEETRVDRLIAKHGLKAFTPATVKDVVALKRLLADARGRGYATQRGETTPSLGTVGVPVFGAGQRVIAVLGLAFPVHVVARERESGLVAILHQAARVLSQRMGCEVYPFGQMRREAPGSGGAHRVGRRAAAARAE